MLGKGKGALRAFPHPTLTSVHTVGLNHEDRVGWGEKGPFGPLGPLRGPGGPLIRNES